MKPKIIALVGPNASGKSELGVALAKRYGGEIVSADSRQVYRGLDLGSGKITAAEKQGVPHHMLDICRAGDFFSMADYQRLAYGAIDAIVSRGRLPFLVGGTGLYAESVTEGYLLSNKKPDLAYRAELEELDTGTLYGMLLRAMPEAGVDPQNRNRVMRLLERLREGDVQPPRRERRYESLRLGTAWRREPLQERIRRRLHRRLSMGMVEEVEKLLKAGVSRDFLLGLGLEYRFITRYLEGEIVSLAELENDLFIAIRQLAKRQMTWFRRDEGIRWLNMEGDPLSEAMALIDAFMARPPQSGQ